MGVKGSTGIEGKRGEKGKPGKDGYNGMAGLDGQPGMIIWYYIIDLDYLTTLRLIIDNLYYITHYYITQ